VLRFNMMVFIVIGLLMVSFLFAVWSLRDYKKHHAIGEQAKESLKKKRVVFTNDEQSSSNQ